MRTNQQWNYWGWRGNIESKCDKAVDGTGQVGQCDVKQPNHVGLHRPCGKNLDYVKVEIGSEYKVLRNGVISLF